MTLHIAKQLGVPIERNVKLTLPAAFLEYIEEIAVKQKGWKDISDYCSYELTRAMIAHLDRDKDIVLPSKKYTVPRAIAFEYDEILGHYIESYREKVC